MKGGRADLSVTSLSVTGPAYLLPGLYAADVKAGPPSNPRAQAAVRVDAVPRPVLTSVSLAPESPTVGQEETLSLEAIGRFADSSTRRVTTLATWSTADPTVATVSGAGTVKGIAPGTTLITATVGLLTIATPVTINPPQLLSIAVTPANRTILRGQTVQYAATGQFSDGTNQDVSARVTWTSTSTPPGVATITSAGLATGAAAGSATITATLGTVTGSTTLTVNPPLLQQVRLTPISPAILGGDTQQFTATGTFSDGTTQDLTATATWTSSVSSVATVASGGLATGVGRGTTVIRATVTAPNGTFYGETSLTVLSSSPLQSIQVTSTLCDGCSIQTGATVWFTATGVFADSTTQDISWIVTWTSSLLCHTDAILCSTARARSIFARMSSTLAVQVNDRG